MLTLPVFSQKTIIAGQITDGRTDTIYFQFFQYRLSHSQAGVVQYTTVAKNGRFHLELPAFPGMAYFKIQTIKRPRLYLENALISQGDSIFMQINPRGISNRENINGRGIVFSGCNYQRAQMRYELDSIANIRGNWLKTHFAVSQFQYGFDSLMAYEARAADTIRKMYDPVFVKNETGVSQLAYQVYKADILYIQRNAELNALSWAFREKTRIPEKPEMLPYFLRHFFQEPELKQTSRQARELSWACADYQLSKMLVYDVLTRPENETKHTTGQLLKILQQVPEETRQFTATDLAAYIFTNGIQVPDTNTLLDSLQHIVSIPYLKKVLQAYQTGMSRGAPLFPFRFQDMNGNLVSSESLKGKTLLLDFWFTSCIPCKQVAKQMPLVKSLLHDPSRFRFVSISLDPNKTLWNYGLSSGLYTDSSNLNLYTNGLAEKHPFLQHYGIFGVPRLLIIDSRGRIYYTNPQVPLNTATARKLADELEEAADSDNVF